MSAKSEYRELCRTEESLPLFSRDWWLDAVCGSENWDVAVARGGGRIVASLPYIMRRIYGCRVIRMPLVTPTLGVWIRYPERQKYAHRLSLEKKLMTELISQLPAFHHFVQRFHPTLTNWMPFYWRGFDQTTYYTYVIDDLQALDRVFAEFKSNVRGKIRKASKLVEVTSEGSIEDFYHLVEMSWRRQKLRPPYSREFLCGLDETLRKHESRELFFAVDAQGRRHSAILLTWDGSSSYLQFVGEDPDLRTSGAGSLLVWEAIRYTREVLGLGRFDFSGNMVEAIEEVRRSFGARQVPYFVISKDRRNPVQRALLWMDARRIRASREY